MPGGKHGSEDRYRRSGCRRRGCRRPYGAGRRGCDVHRSMARACRAHEEERPARHRRQGRRGILGCRARAARHGRAGASKEAPVDIAFICMKSYDTAWATTLIRQYLAPDGYVVSLQNCMNEETIAGIVGWSKTLGCIASSITVNLPEPGHIHRGAGKGGAAHTVFRAGEVHGRITQRAEEIRRLVGYADSAKVTGNLWGERWSQLGANAMGNGLSACTGLPGGDMLQSEPIRRFSTRLGREAVRVGQAHGYQLEEILTLPPETIARAGEGDEAAMRVCDRQRFKDGQRTSSEQRPSMGQDMQKGRSTEIEFLNGFVVREGEKVGLSCSANAVLTDIVKRVERNELSPDPRHITELRLN